MDVKIDADAMSVVVTKALMEGISQEQRDLVIEQAVKALVTPPRTSYGVTPATPLQEAFDSAVRGVAGTAVRRRRVDQGWSEVVSEREVRPRVGAIIRREGFREPVRFLPTDDPAVFEIAGPPGEPVVLRNGDTLQIDVLGAGQSVVLPAEVK